MACASTLGYFFPKRRIAIEYQGIQHSKPVEFFGGADAFERQAKRDEKKAKLCEENGCVLIYVFKQQETAGVVNRIHQLLASKTAKLSEDGYQN
jgi:hypothetical protein